MISPSLRLPVPAANPYRGPFLRHRPALAHPVPRYATPIPCPTLLD